MFRYNLKPLKRRVWRPLTFSFYLGMEYDYDSLQNDPAFVDKYKAHKAGLQPVPGSGSIHPWLAQGTVGDHYSMIE